MRLPLACDAVLRTSLLCAHGSVDCPASQCDSANETKRAGPPPRAAARALPPPRWSLRRNAAASTQRLPPLRAAGASLRRQASARCSLQPVMLPADDMPPLPAGAARVHYFRQARPWNQGRSRQTVFYRKIKCFQAAFSSCSRAGRKLWQLGPARVWRRRGCRKRVGRAAAARGARPPGPVLAR